MVIFDVHPYVGGQIHKNWTGGGNILPLNRPSGLHHQNDSCETELQECRFLVRANRSEMFPAVRCVL